MRLLNIQCSPRGSNSVSIAVADALISAVRDGNPSVEIDTLNVWDEHMPEFDAEAIGAKYKGVSQTAMDAPEAKAWEAIKSLASRFERADRIVLGVPMWNFAYPYKLKQLIDLVSQRNMLFTFDGRSFGPLLKTPAAAVIYTRGQSYALGSLTPATQFDHQTAYIEFWLRFIGVQEVKTLIVEKTWGSDDQAADSITRAKQGATRLAASF